MMRLGSMITLQPVSFLFLLAFAVMLLPTALIPCWYSMISRVERQVNLNSHDFHSKLQYEIENTTKFLHPINSSATNLAGVLKLSLNGTKLSFSMIETKVAPPLFQAWSTIPYLSQISYTGLEGLFFSYYTSQNQTLAVYSNSTYNSRSSSPNVKKNFNCYIQHVNHQTGELYGNSIECPPLNLVSKRWFQEALNSTNGYASLETGWNNSQDLILLSSARINGEGVISLGFSAKVLTARFTSIDRQGGSLYLATKDGKVLIEELKNTHMVLAGNMVSVQLKKPNGEQKVLGNVSCIIKDGSPRSSTLNIQGTEYMLYCSSLDMVGVQSVYVLAFPQKGLVSLVRKNRTVVLALLIVIITSMVVSILSFAYIFIRAAKREMHLCAALIKQMEATQQAERKSMNKSLAFASASHDVRASLAGLTGLIELCYEEANPGSELETNLRQMDTCAEDLLGLLNSILDTSKIEAGKMQLEEEEFDLAQLLEDVVDLYHPVGIKKGVDVVLDPYDGSAIKFSQVKGDRGKLKQILCNLLSNAVKFTCEGHVTVRTWVRKPSLQNSIIASNQNGLMKYLQCLFRKSNEAYNDLEAMNAAQQDPNAMEFVFEVDDTGKGIPKEKQISVFENYVQVKETALGQGGTGLGLGIVQSLVRLMHGDISIVDKEIGEKGTCFRFNVILSTCENVSCNNAKAEDLEMVDGSHTPELTLSTPSPGSWLRTPSSKLTVHTTPSPKVTTSHVVLLIQNNERRRTSQRFMENLRIRVSVAKQWEHLPSTLQKIKHKENHSCHNSLGKSDLSSPSGYLSRSASNNSSGVEKDVPLSSMDGSNYILSVFKRTTPKFASSFILIVIDASAGPFLELCRIVAEFRKGLHNATCKVVWLEKPMMRNINFKHIEEDLVDPNDVVISKPFHGSRLYQVVRLLPEFGGTLQGNSSKLKEEIKFQAEKVPKDPSSSRSQSYIENSSTNKHSTQQVELQDLGSSIEETKKKSMSPIQTLSHVGSKPRSPPSNGIPPKEQEIQEIQEIGNSNDEKPLSGKKLLVADDNVLLRKLTVASLLKLGATAETCVNGQEALDLVCKGLSNQSKLGISKILPYDYVLMDCEMPVMNGYEATKQIRKMEKSYGVHIPIIALTAHTSGGEANVAIEAGMDVHLGKPLKKEHLLEAIRYIDTK
uniref:histidine kinase n=1 Tax=Quercus lobata TaxID=97700 RepID=A0A7N2L1N0_QUELO